MTWPLRVFLLTLLLCCARVGAAAMWSEPVRGSWVSDRKDDGAATLVDGEEACDIVVADDAGSIVRQAATFLAGDIEKISGRKPAIMSRARDGHVAIVLATASNREWESFKIRTARSEVQLTGSDPRGTAFAAYTLSERLGIDPLYHWTGYQPTHHNPLRVKSIDYSSGPPTFKYRGMFHDDEDILPRPFDDEGRPLVTGDVPTEWYAKYFETALRLKMNMVAPYTRVHRRYEVQKMASDWGLFYTSHHYDILLSNPYGITRFGLGAARGSGTDYNWFTNRDGILRFWRGGVEENKDLDCVWPVGMRGTDDVSYKFPPDMSEAEKTHVFNEVIAKQVEMVKQATSAPDRPPPVFHFTLYHEMLEKYRAGAFDMPSDVILVWTDDDDGTMRDLPRGRDKWKHGVYYHLAYLGRQVKQNASIVPPQRIAEQFRKIVDSGATEYMLVNVSEQREFVFGARMLADICWNAPEALAGDDPAQRYVEWWSREYFGDAAGPLAGKAYAEYFRVLNPYDKQWFGSDCVQTLLGSLSARISSKKPSGPPPDLRDKIKSRLADHQRAEEAITAAANAMKWPQRQYFLDSVALPLRFDSRPTEAAAKLLEAVDEPDDAKAWQKCVDAMAPLEKLETEILAAEHPPFENWYRHTWIRRSTRPWNVHRPYEELRLFLSTSGREFQLNDPPTPSRDDSRRGDQTLREKWNAIDLSCVRHRVGFRGIVCVRADGRADQQPRIRDSHAVVDPRCAAGR